MTDSYFAPKGPTIEVSDLFFAKISRFCHKILEPCKAADEHSTIGLALPLYQLSPALRSYPWLFSSPARIRKHF